MATLTITIAAQDNARIQKAFGSMLSLERDATGAEVKETIINWVKSVVRQQEKLALALPADIEPS